jgi:uncharacterized protein
LIKEVSSLKKKERGKMQYRKQITICKKIVACFALIFLVGCASALQRQELNTFDQLYYTGQYNEAANMELKKKGKRTDSSELLQALEAALALRYAKQYQKSSDIFDECEEVIKRHNEQLLSTKAAANVGATLVNDTVLDYRGTEYDGIMVNTYKALNFWQAGQNDLARVEFNRALDRQRRAKERFAAEIAKQKEELEKKQNQNQSGLDFEKNANNPEIDKILREKYSNLYDFQSYPDFINPFTTYMAALFFMSEKDFSKAADLLKETWGMLEENPVVKEDFATVEKILSGQKDNKNYTWLIFENGSGPVKEEFRIDLPLFLSVDAIKYTGIALPKLKFRNQAYSHLILKDEGKELGQTILLSSMDRVVQTEFKKSYKMIVTRTLVSTLIKTYAQYLARERLGEIAGWAAGIYQAATNSADIRIWTALPKEFQIAKFKAPNSGILSVEIPGGDTINVEVPNNKNSLVYMKIPDSGVMAVYDVIEFDRNL